jgi:glycosyltransferase involved in cell wall biosynthesis
VGRVKNQWGKVVCAKGCDDAPVVAIPTTSVARRVQFIMPYYENPQMLAYQLAGWDSLPDRLTEHLTVIVVDDGSQEQPALPAILRAKPRVHVRLFRIEEDVPWNWLAARNLGMHQADDGWCLLTDIDHVVPQDTLERMIYGEFEEGTIYRFLREEHDGTVIAPHPNTWFMTKQMFWKVGGYDEALSGHYGTDGDYRRRCALTAPVRIMIGTVVRHEHKLDSYTAKYKRKQQADKDAVREIVSARSKDWKPKTLSFAWGELL